jgi:hypothetical protein
MKLFNLKGRAERPFRLNSFIPGSGAADVLEGVLFAMGESIPW